MAGDQPVPDAFRYLRGSRFRELFQILAIPPNPEALTNGLSDQLNAVCLSTTLLQADAYVCWVIVP
jgi:hypothetical protein